MVIKMAPIFPWWIFDEDYGSAPPFSGISWMMFGDYETPRQKSEAELKREAESRRMLAAARRSMDTIRTEERRRHDAFEEDCSEFLDNFPKYVKYIELEWQLLGILADPNSNEMNREKAGFELVSLYKKDWVRLTEHGVRMYKHHGFPEVPWNWKSSPSIWRYFEMGTNHNFTLLEEYDTTWLAESVPIVSGPHYWLRARERLLVALSARADLPLSVRKVAGFSALETVQLRLDGAAESHQVYKPLAEFKGILETPGVPDEVVMQATLATYKVHADEFRDKVLSHLSPQYLCELYFAKYGRPKETIQGHADGSDKYHTDEAIAEYSLLKTIHDDSQNPEQNRETAGLCLAKAAYQLIECSTNPQEDIKEYIKGFFPEVLDLERTSMGKTLPKELLDSLNPFRILLSHPQYIEWYRTASRLSIDEQYGAEYKLAQDIVKNAVSGRLKLAEFVLYQLADSDLVSVKATALSILSGYYLTQMNGARVNQQRGERAIDELVSLDNTESPERASTARQISIRTFSSLKDRRDFEELARLARCCERNDDVRMEAGYLLVDAREKKHNAKELRRIVNDCGFPERIRSYANAVLYAEDRRLVNRPRAVLHDMKERYCAFLSKIRPTHVRHPKHREHY